MRNIITTFAFAITLGVAITALLHSVHVSTLLLLNTERDTRRWEFTSEFSNTSIDWITNHINLHGQINLDEGR